MVREQPELPKLTPANNTSGGFSNITIVSPWCRMVILSSPLLQTHKLSGLFSIGEDLDDEVTPRKHLIHLVFSL